MLGMMGVLEGVSHSAMSRHTGRGIGKIQSLHGYLWA